MYLITCTELISFISRGVVNGLVKGMSIEDRVKLVKANEDDAELLAMISKRAFDSDVDVGASGPGGPPDYDSPKSHAYMMGITDYWEILLDDVIIGAVMVGLRRDKHAEICGLFVDPEFHDQGIATRAFDILWEDYPDVQLWTLGTPEWNVRTKHFYEKLGFTQVGFTRDKDWKGRWYEKNINPDDPYVMMKIAELRDGMRGVDVEGKVDEKAIARTVRGRRRGEPLTVSEATLMDDTSSVVLVLWNEQIRQAKVGDQIRIENGYMKSFRGIRQLNVGRGGKLIILSDNKD